MSNKSIGEMISSLRKEKGMTQNDLAEKMNVTDKAVSKWKRDLSFPDVNTIPKLAEIFHVTVDELMKIKWESTWPVWRSHNFLQRKMKTGDAGNRIIPIDFSKRLNIYNRVRKAWQVLRALFLSQKPVCCGTMV